MRLSYPRKLPTVAIFVASVFLLASCNFISPQRTVLPYSASDGVDVNLTKVFIRNAIAFASSSSESTTLNLVFTIINITHDDVTLNVELEDGSNKDILVPFNPESKIVKMGVDEQIILKSTKPIATGSTHTMKFKATYKTEGKTASAVGEIPVPVLGSENTKDILQEYRTLVPTLPSPSTPSTTSTPSEVVKPTTATTTQPTTLATAHPTH